jgi:hypothetical protein
VKILVVLKIHAAAEITSFCATEGYTYLLGRLFPGLAHCFSETLKKLLLKLNIFVLAPRINNFECLPN